MAPPVGFKQLMEKIEMVEDQCSDESDKAKRNKAKLQDKESKSTDPFVQKKMAIQEKIAETKEVRDSQTPHTRTRPCAFPPAGSGGALLASRRGAPVAPSPRRPVFSLCTARSTLPTRVMRRPRASTRTRC